MEMQLCTGKLTIAFDQYRRGLSELSLLYMRKRHEEEEKARRASRVRTGGGVGVGETQRRGFPPTRPALFR
ncbi:hypothetical protein SKAU_G00364280 [Synaphobranchus kaupii]|uniref:Uncharacterized protein n=1 Tax=Synaphobranchus kaupii TaxID=118154 RepID=A0A9Q1EER0_SYNKA|nr:hypothetical protein SKAU_G00364280 [Synaphobranchus kaupii]